MIKSSKNVRLKGINTVTNKAEDMEVEFISEDQKGITVIRHPKRGLITVSNKFL